MDKTLLLALDLEMNQPSGRIIQVGAVLGDVTSGEIVARFSEHVLIDEVISPEIVALTGITQEAVDAAAPLDAVHARLLAWMRPFEARRVMNPLTWGGGDVETLRRQLGVDLEGWPFGRRWIDAKTIYVAYRMSVGEVSHGGLRRALKAMKMSFEGRGHDAGDDALNTFRIYCALLYVLRRGQGTARDAAAS